MNRILNLIALNIFLFATLAAVAQQSPNPPVPGGSTAPVHHVSTVRGCLQGQRGNYIVVEDETSLVYALKGVGNKLDSYLDHEVEVKGRTLPGTIKTGVNPSKLGSNPSDTEHGVDGLPLLVTDVQTDVHTIAKHCKAADQE
jgi:hypothetical protein